MYFCISMVPIECVPRNVLNFPTHVACLSGDGEQFRMLFILSLLLLELKECERDITIYFYMELKL